MSRRRIIQSIIFLIVGIALFLYVYKDLDLSELEGVLSELKYGWIGLSFLFGLWAHWIRAIRWRLLITPLDYQPREVNLFLSIMILYFTNLIIPRGGEVARCGVVNRYEKVPFSSLLATVLVERFSDFLGFLTICVVVFLWQLPVIKELYANLDLGNGTFASMSLKALFFGGVLLVLLILFYLFRNSKLLFKLKIKIKELIREFISGLKTIFHLRHTFRYIFYTYFIFVLYLMMFYVVFFAYPPTAHLNLEVAILSFTVGTFAFLLPIQAGIGAWHFLVIQSLLLYGIDKETGMMLALIAHTFTNLVYLIFGAIGFAILPIVNNKNRQLDK